MVSRVSYRFLNMLNSRYLQNIGIMNFTSVMLRNIIPKLVNPYPPIQIVDSVLIKYFKKSFFFAG